MPFWSKENVPWTNMHDLNLDWIINTMKETVEQWIAYQTEMNGKYADFTELTTSNYEAFTDEMALWKAETDSNFDNLQQYVHDYFDNLDLNESTRYVINNMIESGEFIEILNPSISATVSAWLASHITPTTPAVDNTLTIQNAAADSAAVGTALEDIVVAEYESTATYKIGDYCLYNNKLYVCNTDIISPESWTETNWTPTNITDDLTFLQSDIANNSAILGLTKKTADNISAGWRLLASGLSTNNVNYKLCKYEVSAGNIILIRSAKPPANGASYQFQKAATVPANGINNNLVGSPVLQRTNTFVVVPDTATWLIISAKLTDDTSGIYVYNITKKLADMETLSNEHLDAFLNEVSKGNDIYTPDTTAKTHNGITFTWSRSVCSANGTATSLAFINFMGGTSGVPVAFRNGGFFAIKVNSSNPSLTLRTNCYVNGIAQGQKTFDNGDNLLVIPTQNLTGLYFRYYVDKGATVDATITCEIKKINPVESLVDSVYNTIDPIQAELDAIANLTGSKIPLTWEQGTININTGVPASSSYFIRSPNLINASTFEGLSVFYTPENDNPESLFVYAMLYDENENYIGNQSAWSLSGAPASFDLTPAAYYYKLVARWPKNENDTYPNITPEDGALVSAEGELLIVSKVSEEKIDAQILFATSNLAASYNRFAVVGDSLSAGRIYSNPSYPDGNDVKSISWPVVMARKLGTTVYNCSIHGQSADTFIKGYLYDSNPSGSRCGYNQESYLLDGNHDSPLIIIALGVNNHNGLPTGSTEDINTSNPASCGNTRYGWYGRMVLEIADYYNTAGKKTDILLTLPAIMPQGISASAAKNICTRVEGVYNTVKSTVEASGYVRLHLLDFRQYTNVFSDSIYHEAVNRKHWTALGYNAVAMACLMAVNDWIVSNAENLLDMESNPLNSYLSEEDYLDPDQYM